MKNIAIPLSALAFYLSVFTLWQLGFIPSPAGILGILEGLYRNYGLAGLFAASSLEGIVYFGLYFPGSFVVALAVVLSDGTFPALIAISAVVAAALTLTSSINYILGRRIAGEMRAGEGDGPKRGSVLSKGLIFACLHPNALAFYFFQSGIKKRNAYKIALVPVIMVPYGFALANLLFFLKEPLKRVLEAPYLMISALLLWIALAFLFGSKKG